MLDIHMVLACFRESFDDDSRRESERKY